jgi:CubicO group peptidase (beta-lactamase class C family)
MMPARKAGLSARQLEVALGLVAEAVSSEFVPGAAAAVSRHGRAVRHAAFGRSDPGAEGSAVRPDTIFLIASLTKPVVCAGAMLLVQEGQLALEQRVIEFVPEFGARGKEATTIRHLMTHTSGLPDQLPSSPELRGRHAPIEDFMRATCECEPLFAPGTRVSYQSMGILMLAEVVQRLSGQSMRDFLRERLFAPLRMDRSTLGLPCSGMEGVALSLPAPFPPGNADVGSDWNTPYWRAFGAPWGGLHSTVEDLSHFLAHVLGEAPGPLSAATRRAMTADQVPATAAREEALSQRWGLGFMLGAPFFGDLTSARTFGHVGATGTLYWADPESGLATVLLSNQPRLLREAPAEHQAFFARYSNALAASVR